MNGIINSFAGGIVASGSKVGCNNYRFPMPASTSHVYCPTLKKKIPDSRLPDGVGSVYEIVMNGIDEAAVKKAMKAGIRAAAGTGRASHIGASNFDGELGPYRIHLHNLFR
jgi:formylmethanofuran--tetrahydromethanopterin N-formyltransferase